MNKFRLGTLTALVAGFLTVVLLGLPAKADDGGKYHKWKRSGGHQVSFEELDTNSDGMITAEDIEAYQEVRFNNIDTDGDSMISQEEWEANFEANISEGNKSRIAKMFDRIDNNDDGMISTDELPAKKMNFERILDKLDQDGDGAISKEEFDEGKFKGKRKSGKRSNKERHNE